MHHELFIRDKKIHFDYKIINSQTFQVEVVLVEVAMDRLVGIPATVNQVAAEEAVHRDTDSLQAVTYKLPNNV